MLRDVARSPSTFSFLVAGLAGGRRSIIGWNARSLATPADSSIFT